MFLELELAPENYNLQCYPSTCQSAWEFPFTHDGMGYDFNQPPSMQGTPMLFVRTHHSYELSHHDLLETLRMDMVLGTAIVLMAK